MVNNREEDLISEDKRNTTDQTPNQDIIDLKAETDPREEEISLLEEEDLEPLKASQDFSEVEVKLTARSQSKGGFHLLKRKWTL